MPGCTQRAENTDGTKRSGKKMPRTDFRSTGPPVTNSSRRLPVFCVASGPNLKAGEIPQPGFPDDYNLGDIFLGVEYIFQQCKEKEDYYDVLTVTATHGLCHLLGFTHNSETEWQKMYLQEKQVLEELSRRTGAQLQPLSRGLF
ncbi:endoribonuclease YbeY isoform X3 [Octodon degus]|uniref:Endoribonuclease YbeY isoform X3 n=1 Tax=Octodon degus TaxID=10160 RepID=A0A6P6EHV3_OCTDE|nr:endoribonuclease YbeY isoform X3 [Octodon degus]